MDTAFAHPHCPATYPTSSMSPKILPLSPTPPQVRNDALVYLAFAVAGFAAVPTLFWLREKRQKDKERRKNPAMLECLQAKMDATRTSASKAHESPACPIANPTPPEPILVHENRAPGLNEDKKKKKRSKDRRKRGRDREPSRAVGTKKCVPSSGPLPAAETLRDPSVMDYTPRPSEQPCFSGIPDERRAPSPRSPCMLDIASPTPLPLISPSFRAPSLDSPHGCSETSSRPGQSRSTSVSPTTAPLTPPQLSSSVSLPPLVAIKEHATDPWLSQPSDIPHNDPAWDWDGQSSTYSVGSLSRAPSASECHPLRSMPEQQHATNNAALSSTLSSPASPTTSAMPSAPSLVFPSLNAHPPPGASLATQIASLKGALEASRTREDKYRREAERWSKECDLIKWRWNEATDVWNRREAEFQAQIHHLVLQLQTLTHAMQAASLSPPMSFLPPPGQTPFPHTIPFSSHHGSPFSMPPTGTLPDVVNEDLAEAILKRPGSIRSSVTSNSLGATRCNGEQRVLPEDAVLNQKSEHKSSKLDENEVIEFEFPTLLDRRMNSPRADNGQGREAVLSINAEVEIFH